MKTIEQLKAKIAAMPREALELFAHNVVLSVYGEVIQRKGRQVVVLNERVEWTQSNIEEVGADVDRAKLNPDAL